MTCHLTQTGYIEFLDEWGHGKRARHDWSKTVAVVITDNGDDRYQAWKYSGKRVDAMSKLSEFWMERQGVSVMEGMYLTLEEAPSDFWIEGNDGTFTPDIDKYSNIIS
jgi:hypothetical protein